MAYPTSQQLQELRDSFAQANGLELFGPEEGGAWDVERRCGIGYRIQPLPGPCWHEDPNAHRAYDARRGANELRTELFLAQVLEAEWPGPQRITIPAKDVRPGDIVKLQTRGGPLRSAPRLLVDLVTPAHRGGKRIGTRLHFASRTTEGHRMFTPWQLPDERLVEVTR